MAPPPRRKLVKTTPKPAPVRQVPPSPVQMPGTWPMPLGACPQIPAPDAFSPDDVLAQHTPEQIQAAKFQLARESFQLAAKLFHEELFPGIPWVETNGHTQIFGFLQRAYTEAAFRGCLNLPPRFGKTQLMCMFIAWAMGRDPDCEFLYGSYSGELAQTSGVLVRKIMTLPCYKAMFPSVVIDKSINARDRFATTAGGAMYSRGTEGTITGIGAGKYIEGPYKFKGMIIGDDLLKLADARSEVMKAAVKNFIVDTFNSRRNDYDRTPVIYIGQRAAVDDPFGHLCPEKGKVGVTGEVFETLCIPILDDNDRSIWEGRFPTLKMHALRLAQPWMFMTQMMQRPYNEQGVVFNVDMMPTITVRPTGPRLACRGWDLAARLKKSGVTEPDFTAKGMLVYYPEARMYVIEDANMYRNTPDKVRADIKNTANRDGRSTKIRIPQDPAQAGVWQAQEMAMMLTGFKLNTNRVTGDKRTLADPFAAQCNVGLVGILEPFVDIVKGQLRPFPDGAHDDLVDCLSVAYAELAIPDEDELSRQMSVAAITKLAGFSFDAGLTREATDATIDGTVNDEDWSEV